VTPPALAPLSGLPELWVPVGPLEGGAALHLASDGALDARRDPARGRHRFRFASGFDVEGRVLRVARHDDGRLMAIELADARVAVPGAAPLDLGRYTLLATGEPRTAHAGAVDSGYYADTTFSPVRVPRPRAFPSDERALLDLYERAESAHRGGPAAIREVFPRVHDALDRHFPGEWLLRWNLLETLLGAAPESPLVRPLVDELERLEIAFDGHQPIASGLRALRGPLTPSGRPAAAAARPAGTRRAPSRRRTRRARAGSH
jgi:hypothetical protein